MSSLSVAAERKSSTETGLLNELNDEQYRPTSPPLAKVLPDMESNDAARPPCSPTLPSPQRISIAKAAESLGHNEKSKSSKHKRKRPTGTNNTAEPPPLINLIKGKQKPVVKSRMFMKSESSIYAAICRCDSLLQTLSVAKLHRDDDNNNHLLLSIIDAQFGTCPIFKEHFDDAILSSSTIKSLSAVDFIIAIEQALHNSVRHLCSKECFKRAYLPIREFCKLWRDIEINESIGTTRGQLLHGWRCVLVPPNSKPRGEVGVDVDVGVESAEHVHSNRAVIEAVEKKRKRNISSPAVIYVSPDGTEYSTKRNVVTFMNNEYCKSFEASPSKHSSSPTIMTSRLSPLLKNRMASPTRCSEQSSSLVYCLANINPLLSPLGLLEELFLDNPWRLLVSTICLNITTRGQVDRVLYEFFQRWPTAEATAAADWTEVSAIISPMGLGTKRAKGLVRFSAEYVELTKDISAFRLTEEQVTGLYCCGQYGWSAYNIFINEELPSGAVGVCDHALQLYVEYQLGRE